MIELSIYSKNSSDDLVAIEVAELGARYQSATYPLIFNFPYEDFL